LPEERAELPTGLANASVMLKMSCYPERKAGAQAVAGIQAGGRCGVREADGRYRAEARKRQARRI